MDKKGMRRGQLSSEGDIDLRKVRGWGEPKLMKPRSSGI